MIIFFIILFFFLYSLTFSNDEEDLKKSKINEDMVDVDQNGITAKEYDK